MPGYTNYPGMLCPALLLKAQYVPGISSFPKDGFRVDLMSEKISNNRYQRAR